MGTALKQITFAQFLARPDLEDDQREELIKGELIVSPAARAWHAEIVRLLRDQLVALNNRDFVLVNDTACLLGKLSVLVPDLAAVRLER